MATYNTEALEKLRDEIRHEGELGKHDQGSWGTMRGSAWGKFFSKTDKLFRWGGNNFVPVSCPSAACAAGWTVINAKAKMLFDESSAKFQSDGVASVCVTESGEVRDIAAYAAEILGLDLYERDKLFAAEPSTAQILVWLDQLIVASKHDRSWADQRQMAYAAGSYSEDDD